MNEYHVPVLLKEAIEYLNVTEGKKYIDCTLGGGGHTTGILSKGGVTLAIDQDSEAIAYSKARKKSYIENWKLTLAQGNFAHLKDIATDHGFVSVAGVLYDLGVSSHQLNTADRGFSFASSRSVKLDMRMDPENQAVTAADLLSAASQDELAAIFFRYGEERRAKRIAKEIVSERQKNKILTSDHLVKIILRVRNRGKNDRTHPATRVFQALRLAVNVELANLEDSLLQAVDLLQPGGRLVVISFHSLEDRIVKKFFRENPDKLTIITNKPITPTQEEINSNPRARSGKLRAAEKIGQTT
ncbi:MAG: Ribosomal RNA small subunit methyltransferase H [Microgenomates group bacterium GW2011_GWA1_48_10]|nr:MAG: Ribosomal RNA small subunit methyltransferase H [Microgenomates group bacterium GW2011_GWA1_48_10]